MSSQTVSQPSVTKNSPDESTRQTDKQVVRKLHDAPVALQRGHFLATAAIVGFWFLAPWTWAQGWLLATAAIWVIGAHLKHTKTLAMHEASHGQLAPNHRQNEIMGILIGTASLTPLSAYRFAHHFHHAHIGTEKDVEVWPYNDTRTGRLSRILAAQCELFLGVIYTPLTFLRAVIVHGGFSSKHGRRIALEYALMIAVWAVVLTLIALNNAWIGFAVGYLVPAAIAGFFQTLRKFIEHMGLFGNTPLTLTRSVIGKGAISRLLSLTMLHEDNHGAHHVFPKVPHQQLPEAIHHMYESPLYEPRQPIYSSYLHAMVDMLPHLLNPRVGSQWLAAKAKAPQPVATQG